MFFKMIKANIITQKKAQELGLEQSDEEIKRGEGENIVGAMCTAKKEKKEGAKEIFLEKYYLKKNGKKDLDYMHLERMEELKKAEEFEKYLGQFDTIKGQDREEYINKNNILSVNKEIK